MKKTKSASPLRDMMDTAQRLRDAYATIVDHLRSNTKDKNLLANFDGTEDRLVKALTETCKSDKEIADDIGAILEKVFPIEEASEYPGGMVTQGPIAVNSMCPHHLMPVRYSIFVSYLPGAGKVLGISKLSRIATLLGARPVLQEQLAIDIVNVLHKNKDSRTFPALDSRGAAATLVGTHTCMSCRGANSDAKTASTELRGLFWEPDMEQKFHTAVNGIKTSHPFS